jgi:aminopeptidase N
VAGRRLVAAALAAALVAGAAACSDDAGRIGSTTTTSATVAVAPTAGARGVGDPYFPGLGNGGYDVDHYDLQLRWDADRGAIAGTTTVTATATQDLSAFDLDLSGLEVRSVAVDGQPATVARDATELVITPGAAIADDQSFTTVVVYDGTPTPLHQGTDFFDVGWQTHGREAFLASEPSGAATFFPVNDHPSDKATYTFHITAPSDQVVGTNGLPSGQTANPDGTTTWDSSARDPMASYLVQIAIGDYEQVDGGRTEGGVPIRHLLHRGPRLEAARATVADTPKMVDLLSQIWGPYPFETYGVLAVDVDLGFALETQTLTLLGSDIATGPSPERDAILVHELAHQWVGDLVSPATWRDIWLNEGMATYAEWLWSERTGGPAAAELARRIPRSDDLAPPTADPGADELFQPPVYLRGAMALQALRERVGDKHFFRTLRLWVEDHRFGVGSTADFESLSADVAGQDLSDLFDPWLHGQGVPDLGPIEP